MLDLDPIKDLLSQQPFNYVHPRHIEALIAEVERVRAENAELKEKEKRLIDVAMSEVNFWSKADIEAIDPQEALDYWVEVLKEAQS